MNPESQETVESFRM